MIQTAVVTLLCYFVVCFMLLIMVLEYLPGTGKTSHLLHKNQLYYRVGETCRWICTKNKCTVSLNLDDEQTKVSREPREHTSHDPLTPLEIEVKRAKEEMKKNALHTAETKTVYSDVISTLTQKGHLVADIKVKRNKIKKIY